MSSQSARKDVVLRSLDNQGRPLRFEMPSGDLVPVPSIVYSSGSQVILTGTTAETTMAQVTIPGGVLGSSGTIIVVALWSHTNNANNKVKRIKYGTFDFATDHTETTTASSRDYFSMHQRSVSSQVTYSTSGFGNSPNAVVTGAVNSDVDQVLAVTGQLQSASDTLTLEAIRIEVYAS